jgi:oligoendopeptidase F
MFAEFEERTHATAEQGQPLTADSMRTIYRTLLEDYLGSKFAIDPQLSLECFRIPHFYNAFYVYKYATGLSAAIALTERILQGGKKELDDYLEFLRGGCSKDPLDLLRDAGVDMEKPAPIEAALRKFDSLLDEFESLME